MPSSPEPSETHHDAADAGAESLPGGERENQSATPATEARGADLLVIGPVLLAVASGAEWMIWLWRTFWRRTVSEAELERYTSLVKPLGQPDYDRPIYLAGATLTVILATVVYFLWRRRIAAAASDEESRVVRFAAMLHFAAAPVVILLPMLSINTPSWSFVAAIAGLAFLVFLHKISNQPPESLPPWPRLPAVWRWGTGCWLALGLVALLLYIPAIKFVSGGNYLLDNYSHWNYYAMAPALAYRHGAALITDCYVQYGVGWPLVLAGLSRFTPLSYGLAMRTAVIWGCLYYGVLFHFLQTLLRRTSWAFLGLTLALWLQCFGGMVGSHKWALPSGTVMRYSVDMLFFLACLYHARSGRAWLGLPIGALAGCGVLFGTDTGLYLTVCMLFYLVAAARLQSPASGVRGSLLLSLFAVPALLVVTAAGLWIASRGTMLHASFWSQWLEAIAEYAGGISDLPIARALDGWNAYSLLAILLISYLTAILWMLERLWRRKATAEDLITGLVALYGMATFLLFVGRSDPPYLRNVSIPFCVVLTRLLLALFEHLSGRLLAVVVAPRQEAVRRALEALPWLPATGLLLALFVDPFFADYPGLLQTSLGNRWTALKAEEDDYLFLSRHDAALVEGIFKPADEPGPQVRNLLRAEYRRRVKNFREVTSAMRDLAGRGNTVGMLDMDDTAYLVESDLRPWFRWSPVLHSLGTRQDVETVKRVLIEHPPDYVFYPAASPLTIFHVTADDIYLPIREVLRDPKHFVFEKKVAGLDIYRRSNTNPKR